MEILYVLLVLLVAARLFGEIAERLNLPSLTGELVAGVVLGLVVRRFEGGLPILAALPDNDVFRAISDLGIFFLMLLAGLELRPRELLRASRASISIAGVGVLVPLVTGIALGLAVLPDSDFRLPQAILLGTVMSITAVPVTTKVLMDLGQLESRAGQTIVAAAIIDDVLGFMLLGVLTAFIKDGAPPSGATLALLGARILIFFAATSLLGHLTFKYLSRYFKRARLEEFELSALVIVALAFSVLAESFGLHFILGAFVAGLFFGPRRVGKGAFQHVQRNVAAMTKGFLAPVFFVSIGLHLEPGALIHVPGLVILLILISFLVKLSAAAPAYWYGLSSREALAVGVGMSARGAVELVIADIALRSGLFTKPDPAPPVVEHLFSAIVLMAVVTTLAPPLILPILLGRKKRSSGR